MQTTQLNTSFTGLSMHLAGHHLQPNELETFFDGLAHRLAIFKTAKKQTGRFIASDFSVSSYISVDEGQLSNILRSLLDPDSLTEILK